MPNQANIKAVITAEDKASAVLKGFGDNVDKGAKSVTSSLNASALAVAAATAGVVAMTSLYALSEHDDKGKSKIEITANGTGDYKKNYELQKTGWQPYSAAAPA